MTTNTEFSQLNLRSARKLYIKDMLHKSSPNLPEISTRGSSQMNSPRFKALLASDGSRFVKEQKSDLKIRQNDISLKIKGKMRVKRRVKEVDMKINSDLKFMPSRLVADIFNNKRAQFLREYKSQSGSTLNSPKNSNNRTHEISLSPPRHELCMKLDSFIHNCSLKTEQISDILNSSKSKISKLELKSQNIIREMNILFKPKYKNKL